MAAGVGGCREGVPAWDKWNRLAPVNRRKWFPFIPPLTDKRAHNPYLVASGLADQPTLMPWFGDKKLIIQFA